MTARRVLPQVLRAGLPAFMLMALLPSGAAAQSRPREHYDTAYIGAPLADPVLQQSKETYVVFGCAYCHGVNLVARGEATDLQRSRLVGRDVNGNLIGPVLRKGIPQTAKLSPMPQFGDLSDRQIDDLVRWIHYARQEARFAALTAAAPPVTGDVAAGRTYFEQSCRTCHAEEAGLRAALAKHAGAARVQALLKPGALQTPPSWHLDRLRDAAAITARARHGALLENYAPQDVANLLAFLAPGAR